MKQLLTLLSIVTIVLCLHSCNSSTTPTSTADYFKGIDKLGNYWIYQNQVIDTADIIQPVSFTDSTVVQGVQLIDGKQATMLVSYPSSDSLGSVDTTYVYRDGDKLYAYIKNAQVPTDTAAPKQQWALLADMSATKPWLAIDTAGRKDTVQVAGYSAVLSRKTWATGEKKSDTTIVAADTKSYSTKSFVFTSSFSGIANGINAPITAPVTYTGGERSLYFADGVALVRERTSPHTITVSAVITTRTNRFAGRQRTLLRYHVQ